MFRVKCGKCGMFTDIDEKVFASRRNENGYISDELSCISCGNVMPFSVAKKIFGFVDAKDLEGWEIHTFVED